MNVNPMFFVKNCYDITFMLRIYNDMFFIICNHDS